MKLNSTKHLILFLSIIAIFLVFCSCKKTGSNPVPNPVIPPIPDTLSTGWTKKVVVSGHSNGGDIIFIDSAIGYSLWDYGTYKTTDGGKTWLMIPSIYGASQCAASSDGKFFTNGSDSPYIRQSFDYGKTFVNSHDSISSKGTVIRFTSNNVCYIATGTNRIFKSIDGGHNWKILNLPNNYSLVTNLNMCMQFINDSTGWVSDGYNTYKTNTSTNQWTKCIIDSNRINDNITITSKTLNAVYLGGINSKALTIDIYKSIDGGVNFLIEGHLPYTTGIYSSIFFTSDNNGYISCGHLIYHSIDGGKTWNVVAKLGEANIINFYFIDDNHGWAICDDGTVLIYKQ